MCILDDIKTELKNVATYVTGSGKIIARDSCHLQDRMNTHHLSKVLNPSDL